MKQLCLSFLLMLLPMVANADEVNIDGINYNLFSDTQTAQVSKCYKSGEVIIPEKVDYSGITYTVTSFKDRAFSGCSGMTTLIIPNTITTVKDYCFSRCTGLKTITIPSSLTSISRSAFYMCNLEQIIVEEGNTVYDSRNNCNAIIETAYDRLYIGCKNTIIPNGIKEIGEFAFDQCNDLTSIVIPEGLFLIGVAAFQGCESLEEINFPSSLVFPGSLATFNICKSLQTIKSDIKRPSDLEADFPESVFANAVLIVPKGTRSAYQSCKGWKNFVNIVEDENTIVTDDDIRTIHVAEAGTLSNYITDADKYNIYDLTLTGELNGTDFRLLRDMAGHDCNNRFTAGKLKKLNLTEVRIVSGGERYLDTDTLSESAYYPGNCSYGKDAFRFSIEENDKMPKYVFRECMLEEVSLPNSAPEIDEYAFQGCRYLKHVIIPDNVMTIGKGAFIYCHGLATITIPSSVTSIGESAFYQNGGVLQSVISEIASPFEIANNVFDNYSIPILTVPVGAKAAYQATSSWNNFMNITEVGSEETFPKRAFRVTKAGTLSDFISEADKYTIEELTLTGYLNGTDFRLLRDMAGYNYKGENTEGKLTKLDLSGVNIEAGGEMYLDATRIKYFDKNNFLGGEFHYSIEQSNTFPTYLFHGCNLESITLPRSINQLGFNALGSCFELKTIVVPGSYTKIDYSAIENSYSLENFEVASSNTYLSSDEGVLFNKDKTVLIVYPRGKTGSVYTIPNTVTELNQSAFIGCSNLTSLNLPNSLTKIGIYAFRDCSQLSSVSLPASVNSLHVSAFEGCKKLSEIIVDTGNGDYSSLDGVLFDKDRKTLICYPMGKEDDAYTVPNGVNTIDSNSFQLCEKLHTVTFPNTVTSIAEWAFGNCTGLTAVNIPKSVTSIGNYAFYGCKNLATITSHLKEPFAIEKEVFWGTQSSNPAQSVDIYGHATLCVPLGCKDKYEVADGWKNFTTIEEVQLGKTIHVATAGTLPDLISETEKYEIEELTLTGELNGTDFRLIRDMAGCNYLGEETEGKLKVLDFSGAKIVAGGEKYVDTDHISNWGGYFRNTIDQDNILPPDVFMGCKLTSVNISNSVTAICDWSLALLRGMTSITIPNSVKTIGVRAFQECSITSITIPKSVMSISDEAFVACNAISSINVESGNIIYDSRNDCNAIIETSTGALVLGCRNSTIPDGVTSIGKNAFYRRGGFTTLVLPEGLTRIGESAFGYCTTLTSVTLPEGVVSIDYYAFEGCSALQTINIPSSMTSIGFAAFRNCSSLTSLHLPQSLTSIGDCAFQRCNSLTSIDVDSDNEYFKSETGILFNKEGTCILCYPANKEGNNYSIPNKVTVIGNCAFGSCSNLSSVNLHDNITIIGDNAFELCSSLTSITIPSSVTSIGSSTFYECNELTSVISKITVPFEINDYAFSNYSKPTLTVPNGTKEVYQATNGWKNFVNIVEAGLEPMENEDEIDYGEDGNVDENTDLEGTIIDNVYYNIAPENGGFDAEEKCIVVNKSMSDDEIESVFGKDLQSDEVKQTFAGLVIEVPAGKGSVKINADATGGMTLKVKIGSADPVTMEFDGRLKVTVPYNVIEPTYVYIYAGESGAASRRRSGDESEKSLSIYALGIASKDLLKGDVNDDESVDVQDVVGVVDYILQRPAEGFGLAAGDVNGDKQINVVDVVGVVDIILGRTNSARRRQSMIDEEHLTDLLSLTRHDDGGFSLDLLNTGRYVATQFDVHLSDGQRLEDVRLNGKRFSGHSLSYTEVAENTYRVLVYSMGNNAIVGQAGELLNFRIAGSEGGFTVDNILFITSDHGIRYFEAMNSLATGIMLIDNGQWTMDNEPADVYSTDGRLVRKSAVSLDGLPKGVYVINGRKVIK